MQIERVRVRGGHAAEAGTAASESSSLHDAAIVFAKRTFVLVILVRGIAEDKAAYKLMAAITGDLYNATN